MIRYLIIPFFLISQLFAQVFEEKIEFDRIRSVKFAPSSSQLLPAVISLNSGQQLVLNFDDLLGDIEYFSYTIKHCTPDWKESDLFYADYASGIEENTIQDFNQSYNTYYRYTNYKLAIPNQSCNILRSGNYILQVYPEGFPDSILIQKRFIVVEPSIKINGKISPPRNIQERNFKQELNFTINYENYNIEYPFTNLKTTLLQNYRWDNAIYNLKPKFLKNKEIIYDYTKGNLFDGNNEFRRFNIASLTYSDEFIGNLSLDRERQIYTAYTTPIHKRTFNYYTSEQDIDGAYKINNDLRENDDYESEYIEVNFNLAIDYPIKDGNFYVFGELSNWQIQPQLKFEYNENLKTHVCRAIFKQGFYNYAIGFVKNDSNTIDLTAIEGNHFQTNNTYSIIVYHQKPTENYYRVIGFTSFKAHE